MSQLDPEIWAIVSEQFHALIDLPVREQREALKQLETEHPAAYKPLLKLLEAESTLHPVLQTAATHPWQLSEDESLVGSEIGIYRLIEHVGSGGMGSVFLAERTTEDFDRKEALKLIRPGGLHEDAIRRFKQERQILANLTHPGIARLYDGGTTTEGRLYFTMEHVEGQDIITYLEARNAGLAERLDLFLKVTEAIAYAHSRLVLHLDLKPSNILVTDAGEVKILDFGVAERLNDIDFSFSSELVEATHRYTLAYGSPEQLQGETLSTQSDIYTLGVLLYQMLIGQLPFKHDTDSLLAYKQRILSERSVRPSENTSFATTDINTSKLTGDLDAIVMQCLSRDATNRYASVDVLINDIEAYQEGRPISLRERDSWYALRKFARRNRAWLSAVAFGIIGLLTLGTYYTSQLRIERNDARSEAEKNKQLLKLMTDVFSEADPTVAQGDTLTVYDLVDQASLRLGTDLQNQPEIYMELSMTLGRIYLSLGDNVKADSMLARCQKVLANTPDLNQTKLHALLLHFKGDVEYHFGLYAEATKSSLEGLAIARGVDNWDKQRYDYYYRLGNLAYEQSQSIKADSFYQLALRDMMAESEPDQEQIAYLTHAMGALNRDIGNFEIAESYLQRSLKVKKQIFTEPHSEIAYTLNNIASLYYDQGKYDTALVYARDGLQQRLATLGDAHLEAAASYGNMYRIYSDLGEPDSALKMMQASARVLQNLFPEAHPYHIGSYSQIAIHYLHQGEPAKATEAFRAGIAVHTELLSANEANPYAFQGALIYHGLAVALNDQAKYEEALPIAQKALAYAHQLNQAEGYSTAIKEATLGNTLVKLARFKEAEPLLQHANSVLSALPERYAESIASIANNLSLIAKQKSP